MSSSHHNRLTYGLQGVSEETPVNLPLRGVDLRFKVTGGAAQVQLEQVFHQTHSAALDCIYTFPLPEDAAVYRCEMEVQGRCIRAVVMEHAAAKKLAQEKKRTGHRTALVELERDNLFTLNLDNVQPGDLIVVRLCYCEALKTQSESLRLRIPVCPGQRYVPKALPDADRISPPRIASTHPEAADFFVSGELASGDLELGSLQSSSHAIMARTKDSVIRVSLVEDHEVPDHDFTLSWERAEGDSLVAAAWSFQGSQGSYALAQLRIPGTIPERAAEPRDFYFLVDRSGSMQGLKWTKTCEALRAFVCRLSVHDRVWITLFESTHLDLTKRPVLASELLRRESIRRFEELGVAGGTELLPAAQHAFQAMREFSQETKKVLILITDGQVGNEEAILSCFKNAGFPYSLFTFGIDTAVNDALLQALARDHRGSCTLLTPEEDIGSAVAGLAGRLGHPLLTEASITNGWECLGAPCFDFFAGESIILTLRHPNHPDKIVLQGNSVSGVSMALEIPVIPSDNPALELLWHRARIRDLLNENRTEEALRLAKTHNLLCKGASFVAWDEAEQCPVATESLHQPSMLISSVACSGGVCVVARARPEPKDEPRLDFSDTGLPPELCRALEALCYRLPREGQEIPKEHLDLHQALLERREHRWDALQLCRRFFEQTINDTSDLAWHLALVANQELLQLIDEER